MVGILVGSSPAKIILKRPLAKLVIFESNETDAVMTIHSNEASYQGGGLVRKLYASRRIGLSRLATMWDSQQKDKVVDSSSYVSSISL